MKKIYLILLSFSFFASFGQNADNKIPDNLSKEIRDARFCGEVVVKSFDTVKVGSTWVLDKINYIRLDINTIQSSKLQTNKNMYPQVGDTCLVIVDKNCVENQCPVSSFAKIKSDKYIFSTQGSSYEINKKDFWDLYKKSNWQFASNH